MYRSKLTGLLKKFSKEEIRDFGLFVNSPYFNREKVLINLYNELRKSHPGFEEKDLDPKVIYKRIFKGKDFNDVLLRNTVSDMLKLALEFLSVQNLQKHAFQKNSLLLSELISRDDEKLFKKIESESEKLLENEKAKDHDYFYDRYLLENKRFNLARVNKSVTNEKNFFRMFDNITLSFIINMLRINTFVLNTNKHMFQNYHNPGLMSMLENYLDDSIDTFDQVYYLKYYYNAFKLAKTQDEKYFYALKDLIRNESKRFRVADRADIFTTLSNYCYFKTFNGEMNFINEQFDLLKRKFETGLYKYESNFIKPLAFMNMVITGLESDEHDMVWSFINKYKNKIEEKQRKDTFTFCRALFHYHKNEFDKAISTAALVNSNDITFKHQIKSLYLKIYFDLNETEPFYYHVDTYKHFIDKDKFFPESTRSAIKNYILFAKKLFDRKNKAGIESDDFELKETGKKIIEHRSLINKPWLLKKIKEIEKLNVEK